jgi:BirA family transcriptional regulator, biotin operon repressor / biotin---[acetyl-CoA-carboxylase] ligase
MRLLEPAPVANLVWLSAVDSTNDVAERFLDAWQEDDERTLPPTVIVAGMQTSGHGRATNPWVSPVGGLYATWVGWVDHGALAAVPMAAGVACARAVEDVLPGVRVGLKWPNDLYLDGCKLGGILCHSRVATGAAWVRIGFGINVALEPVLAVGDPVQPTSLARHGWQGDLRDTCWRLVGRFVAELERGLGSGEQLRTDWVSRSIHRPGDVLFLRRDGDVVEGRFVGFSPDGSLELEVGSEPRRFSSGELLLSLGTLGGE